MSVFVKAETVCVSREPRRAHMFEIPSCRCAWMCAWVAPDGVPDVPQMLVSEASSLLLRQHFFTWRLQTQEQGPFYTSPPTLWCNQLFSFGAEIVYLQPQQLSFQRWPPIRPLSVLKVHGLLSVNCKVTRERLLSHWYPKTVPSEFFRLCCLKFFLFFLETRH